MEFKVPVVICEEPMCVAFHAQEIAQFGRKALVVTGRRAAARTGALSDVCTALLFRAVEWEVFSGVESNPSVETVRKAAVAGRKAGCDFVIGIGGGSPLDAAKAAAWLMKQEDPETADLYDPSLPDDALPVVAVPTTCGTGSEVTGVSVLTLHDRNTKKSIPHKIFPKLALIDGKYLEKAPLSMIVQTSVDALAHMTESYLSVKADDYSKNIVLEGLRIWQTCRDVLDGVKKPDDEDRRRLMRASTWAGAAIAQTGTSIPHALSYIVTYDDKVPHGPACGIFLARFLKEASPEDQKAVLDAAGFRDTDAFGAWIAERLGNVNVSPETLQRAYDTVVKDTARMQGCRIHATPESLKRIAGIE